ncbi:MAG: 2Fe-2S iron-sulfur cluster-binding protein [Desulfobacteraceae bacterium]|jgi:ferredoxin
MQNMTESLEIKILIDGFEIAAQKGQTVLEVARKNGIHIPTICFHPALKPSGSCKMCAVEVEGIGSHSMTMLSCVLKAKEGMSIRTAGEAVQKARTKALKRLFRMAPQSRRLQEMAAEERISLPPAPDGCIHCRLCVRVCKEIVGQQALRMEKKDNHMQVVPEADKCIGCGTCANLCPTHVIEVVDEGKMRVIRKGDVIFGRHPLERCQGCGKYYATEKQVDFAEKRTDPHPHVKLHHHYCPACAKLFSDRLQVVKKQPPKLKFTKG